MHADQFKVTQGKFYCALVAYTQQCLQQYQRLLTTCATFALYTSNFTKSLNQALAQLDIDPSSVSMKVRWDFLIKFRTNFDHWLRVCIQSECA